MGVSTLQRWFDKAYLGLKGQGFRRSIGPVGGCKYRGPDGLKCAVGHLLLDEEVSEEFLPGHRSFTVEGERPSGAEVEFLCALQVAHDNAKEPDKMDSRLRTLASRFGLTVPEGENP